MLRLNQAVLIFALAFGATCAHANEPGGGALEPVQSPAGEVDALSLDELADITGRQNIAMSASTQQRLAANNSGNSINAEVVQSGAVSFSAGAFDGFNGVGNFVINTGNNNNLQGSLSVTVVTLP